MTVPSTDPIVAMAAALDALAAVEALHQPEWWHAGIATPAIAICAACGSPHPCSTVRAIREAKGEQ